MKTLYQDEYMRVALTEQKTVVVVNQGDEGGGPSAEVTVRVGPEGKEVFVTGFEPDQKVEPWCLNERRPGLRITV